jgi:hypothetical protein
MLLTLVASNVAENPSVDPVLKAGRPFRVALDRKISVKRVGQPVSGVAVDAEGGTALTDSKTRLIAPALAILALPCVGRAGRASLRRSGW